MEQVIIVKEGSKLRAKPVDWKKPGNVQFPKALRIEGVKYEVDDLVWTGSYWRAIGTPVRISPVKYKLVYPKPIKPKKVTTQFTIYYPYKYDYDYLNEFIDYLSDCEYDGDFSSVTQYSNYITSTNERCISYKLEHLNNLPNTVIRSIITDLKAIYKDVQIIYDTY